MPTSPWTAADHLQLEASGISIAEAERQLQLLRDGAEPARLARPCTLGDGILQLEGARLEELAECQRAAAREDRFQRFVPASGAATRMFKSLLHFHSGSGRELDWRQIEATADAGDASATEMQRTLLRAGDFPFADELDGLLRPAGGLSTVVAARNHRSLLAAILDAEGMDCAYRPKGLLPFHLYGDGPHTPVEEHLTETAAYTTSSAGLCRTHFTVSQEHQAAFEALLRKRRQRLEEACGCGFEISFSTQSPATDTLGAELDGRPARDPRGQLLFRPGGHGALLWNLGGLGGDLVYVRNIDNVQPAWQRDTTLLWKRVLGGLLVALQNEAHRLVRDLRDPALDAGLIARAQRFCGEQLGLELAPDEDASASHRRQRCLALLDRPMRVCGVVRNTGEPGGGPFWVRRDDGRLSHQIVESAQVDLQRDDQREIFESATHFNPVDLVCGLRDANGEPYDLDRYVDPGAVIVTRKSVAAREIGVLERPGLWNGAMADWTTVFVEVPLATFTPVKTVLDLLRPEHQPI